MNMDFPRILFIPLFIIGAAWTFTFLNVKSTLEENGFTVKWDSSLLHDLKNLYRLQNDNKSYNSLYRWARFIMVLNFIMVAIVIIFFAIWFYYEYL